MIKKIFFLCYFNILLLFFCNLEILNYKAGNLIDWDICCYGNFSNKNSYFNYTKYRYNAFFKINNMMEFPVQEINKSNTKKTHILRFPKKIRFLAKCLFCL